MKATESNEPYIENIKKINIVLKLISKWFWLTIATGNTDWGEASLYTNISIFNNTLVPQAVNAKCKKDRNITKGNPIYTR